MPRHLDHLVLCTADLDRAQATYRRLGFTLTPPAKHPFGTRNRLVQLPGGNFLELLAMGDPAAIPAGVEPGQFGFAARSQAFLRDVGEGMSMLVYTGADARADVARFRAAGLTTYPPFDFGRDAVLPDGNVARVAFSLAFATHPAIPDLAFFTCQPRHAPEMFWKPEYQAQPNGAQRVVEVVISAAEPAKLTGFFADLSEAPVTQDDDGRAARVGLSEDCVTLLDPGRLRERYGEAVAVPAGSPRFAAFRLTVTDIGRVRAILDEGGVPYRVAGHGLVVPPAAAHGVIIEFSGSGAV